MERGKKRKKKREKERSFVELLFVFDCLFFAVVDITLLPRVYSAMVFDLCHLVCAVQCTVTLLETRLPGATVNASRYMRNGGNLK